MKKLILNAAPWSVGEACSELTNVLRNQTPLPIWEGDRTPGRGLGHLLHPICNRKGKATRRSASAARIRLHLAGFAGSSCQPTAAVKRLAMLECSSIWPFRVWNLTNASSSNGRLVYPGSVRSWQQSFDTGGYPRAWVCISDGLYFGTNTSKPSNLLAVKALPPTGGRSLNVRT